MVVESRVATAELESTGEASCLEPTAAPRHRQAPIPTTTLLRMSKRHFVHSLATGSLFAALAFAGCSGDAEESPARAEDVSPEGATEPMPSSTSSAPTASPAATAPPLVRRRNLAIAYLEAEKHAEARRLFAALATDLPDEPMIQANLGLIALRENDLAAARTHLERAAQGAPGNGDIAILRHHLAVFEGLQDESQQVLEEAIAADPDNVRVRWALIEALQHRPDAAAARAGHMRTLLAAAPANVTVRLAVARALIESEEKDAARTALQDLDAQEIITDGQVRQLYTQAIERLDEENLRAARSMVIALNNVMKPTSAWQNSLAELRGPPVPVAEPVWSFLATDVTEPTSLPRAIDVTFVDVAGDRGVAVDGATAAVVLQEDPDGSPMLAVVQDGGIALLEAGPDGRYAVAHQLPLNAGDVVTRMAAIDWSGDRQLDLVLGFADGSVRTWSRNEEGAWPGDGAELLPAGDAAVQLIFPFDVDQDGDLDVFVGRTGAATAVLRNNADGTFIELAESLGLDQHDVVSITSADLDHDGDLEFVTVDGAGVGARFENLRSGRYAAHMLPLDELGRVAAVTAADLDNDGAFELVFVTRGGGVIALNSSGMRTLAPGTADQDAGRGTIRELDFDNDGWLDLVVEGDPGVRVLRNDGGLRFEAVHGILPAEMGAVRTIATVDLDADGDTDLFAVLPGGTIALLDNEGGNAHGWQRVRLDSIIEGGQRNNSFALGGTVELRAGQAYQIRVIRDPLTTIGLGSFGPADAIRIVWPNGVPQVIIEPEANEAVVEAQHLKGSCPMLFAWNGGELSFVTDLLWRSPLGLKINAQVVAQVGSTKDYVRIAPDQLVAHHGRYDMEVSAPLWETHFFDEITLLAVDHPAELEVYVDERFRAPLPPPFELHVVGDLRAPISAVDHRGADVLGTIAHRDGERLGGFAKGRYQGIAEPHFVELDLGPWDAETKRVRLLASGWIMPTDTSINVASAQGDHAAPRPLRVLIADGEGGWIEHTANAGFPAGKLKTIVLDLPATFPSSDHRVRLETNLEIYWDRLALALGDPAFDAHTVAAKPTAATLDYQGFPEMIRERREDPELPDYTHPVTTARWRDLHGWYTRYGDVAELIEATDDRYVIMNAGDRIRLSFEAQTPPPAGWVRTFILFSDGWVKDGDLNTVESMTAGPLPWHTMTDYPGPGADMPASLRPDHPDWQRFHTRWVDSRPFDERMRPADTRNRP